MEDIVNDLLSVRESLKELEIFLKSMEQNRKITLNLQEELKETYITMGLCAGWGLSSSLYILLPWFRNSCKNRRWRTAGSIGITALFGAANLLVIKWL